LSSLCLFECILIICVIQGIFPFHLKYQIHWHKIIVILIFVESVVMSLLSFLTLLICEFFLFLTWWDLSTILIFLKSWPCHHWPLIILFVSISLIFCAPLLFLYFRLHLLFFGLLRWKCKGRVDGSPLLSRFVFIKGLILLAPRQPERQTKRKGFFSSKQTWWKMGCLCPSCLAREKVFTPGHVPKGIS
jgi:hypothetical protein